MKLIIWDCDETLWEGKVMYGDVKLKKETKEVLKQIDKLGISQAICSKNDFDGVHKWLKKFEIDHYFKTIKANWEPKHLSINTILSGQRCTAEETLFIDDEAINRDEVKQLVGCHVDFESDLYQILKYFDTDRLKLMNQQRDRTDAEKTYRGTFKDFLENSGMVCEIKEGHKAMLTRLTNLTNRTNELNASRNRYSKEEVESMLSSEDYLVYVAFLKDKYGDYGIIGEIIVDITTKGEWFIKDLCVSCRTMGRGIGKKLLRFVKQKAREHKVTYLYGEVNIKEDNWRMPKLYEQEGFRVVNPEANPVKYDCNLNHL